MFFFIEYTLESRKNISIKGWMLVQLLLCVYLSSCILPFSISLTVGASRHMEEQMELPRLLFGVGFL